MAHAEDEQKKMEEEFEKTKESLGAMEKKYKLLEERCVMLDREKETLRDDLQVAEGSTGDQEERLDQLLKEKHEFEDLIKDMEERITDAEGEPNFLTLAIQNVTNYYSIT